MNMHVRAVMIGASILGGCMAEVAPAGENLDELYGCFTSGELAEMDGSSMLILHPETRGVVPGTGTAIGVAQEATLTFTYEGETEETIPLGSGAIRHQLGLKLRAQDPCNTLYVMWRLDDRQIAVQVKRNPGESTSAECGNDGYGTVKYSSNNVPVAVIGEPHTLYARVINQSLRIEIDGNLVWQGSLVTTATPNGADFVGDFGWRTDNAEAWMELSNVSSYDPSCD